MSGKSRGVCDYYLSSRKETTEGKGEASHKVWQIDGSEIKHTVLPMKFYKTTGANLVPLTCEVLQGMKLTSNKVNNTILKNSDNQVVADWRFK